MIAAWLTLKFTNWAAVWVLMGIVPVVTQALNFVDRIRRWRSRRP